MPNKSCPFCQIEEDRILLRFRSAYVAFSVPRLMPGHLLVIPNRHLSRLDELTLEEVRDMFAATTDAYQRILKWVAPGCDASHHFRPFLPDGTLKVAHLHVHLRPRFPEDELYRRCQIREKGVFQNPEPGEIKQLKEALLS